MKRGQRWQHNYGWSEAETDLATGVSPAVVAARIGEPEDYVREVADRQGWPIAHRGVSAEDRRIADWLDS